MLGRRTVTLLFAGAVTFQAAIAGPQPKMVRPKMAARQAERRAEQQQAVRNPETAAGQLRNHPGEQALQRLAQMTPEQREKALASLPPARREMLTKRLQNFETYSPAARERATSELERLHSLPPQKQAQVRRSLKQLQQLPDDRRAVVGPELERLNALPDEERRARINSEEFRNKYSPSEQQMMSNLSEVLPQE